MERYEFTLTIECGENGNPIQMLRDLLNNPTQANKNLQDWVMNGFYSIAGDAASEEENDSIRVVCDVI